ncbi:uncharacterized protein A1O5_06632 [Cladophialophora psammophila CBS 110553]|uniref:Zn(2)-C6 fungal-type domain-containing protein n=1 Tax=Cladophialophora psammophila CBS 110553 TaxID=1182543 RepID=W9WQT3_9EURO|nr:uncharacterized protein A1O5_06632 [Cladophialophora psammophila CBS 110553]EXJ70562.1 hypothetical protein A1O5_06632 [Cladophialophora psammophila CBS 110553]
MEKGAHLQLGYRDFEGKAAIALFLLCLRWCTEGITSEQSTSALSPPLAGDQATGSPQPVLSRRACTECRRKKAKCDMKRPFCSLCLRVGESCVYPVRRAHRRKPRDASTSTSQSQEVPGLTTITIGPGSLDALPPSTNYCTQYATGSGMSQSLPSVSIPDGNLHFPELVSGQYPGFSPPNFDGPKLASELPPLPLFDPDSLGQFTSTDYDGLWDNDPKHAEACHAGPTLPNANLICLASPRNLTRLRFDVQVSASVALDLIDGFFEHVHIHQPLGLDSLFAGFAPRERSASDGGRRLVGGQALRIHVPRREM